MAKLLKGLFGPISGKVGNMVFVSRRDQCYVRSLPRPSSKPASAAQIEQRSKFALVVRFVKPLVPLIQYSYASRKPGITGMNALVRHLLSSAVVGAYPEQQIDYPAVSLSRGRLAAAYVADVAVAAPDRLKFKWAADLNFNAFADDELIIVLYRESLGQFWFDPGMRVKRADGSCTIRVPEIFTFRETHIWIAFRSASKPREYSDSRYLGTLYNKSNR